MTQPEIVRLSLLEPDVALLTFDDPNRGANVVSREALGQLEQHLDALEQQSGLKGIVLASGKPGVFVAGADLREFAAATDVTKAETIAVATRGREIFRRLTRMPLVTVAAIDGLCLGGGAELALWCDYRLMTSSPKSQIGMPEVKLGLFPGWGGTAITPRLVGLPNAVELITGGESVDGRAAVEMGLATDCVASEQLLASAVALVRSASHADEYLHHRQRVAQAVQMSETELIFLGATASAMIQQQTKGHYPAPTAALELMLETASLTLDEACEREAAGFAELFGTPVNRALLNVFFLGDRNKKDSGIPAGAAEPQAIRSVGIIGAGIMGSGIAAACVKRRLQVTITDTRPDALAVGVQKALEEVAYNKQTKATDPQKLLEFAPLLKATMLDEELAACDLVIEAVVENAQVKEQLYQRLSPHLGSQTLLASNTSAISIGELARGASDPARFVGIHFFNPVRKMPLVEVIRGPQTSDQSVATAVAFAKAIGKSPVVVADGPGFLVNRLLLPYMNEALELLLEGHTFKEIESAAKDFGMPMGPLTLYDVVGLDTALFAGRVMAEAFPQRVGQSPLLAAMVAAGRLGQKSGLGFLRYADSKGRGKPDPSFDTLLEPLLRGQGGLKKQQLIERLFLPMVLEATRVLSEGKVRDARDVDLGLIYGIGFPPFKGGLLFWADTLGAAKIVEMLAAYESLGERYQPTKLLLDLAQRGGRFYDTVHE